MINNKKRLSVIDKEAMKRFNMKTNIYDNPIYKGDLVVAYFKDFYPLIRKKSKVED